MKRHALLISLFGIDINVICFPAVKIDAERRFSESVKKPFLSGWKLFLVPGDPQNVRANAPCFRVDCQLSACSFILWYRHIASFSSPALKPGMVRFRISKSHKPGPDNTRSSRRSRSCPRGPWRSHSTYCSRSHDEPSATERTAPMCGS